MYLKFIGIKNQGSIDELKIEPNFNKDGTPKPILIVGENGSGKTTLLSSIVDSFYEMAGNCFINTKKIDENSGKKQFYKILSDGNCDIFFKRFSFNILEYSENIKYLEHSSIYCNDNLKYEINQLRPNFLDENTEPKGMMFKEIINSNLNKIKIMDEFKSKVHLYLPAYRYEEPYWKAESYHHKKTKKEKETFSSNEYYKEIEAFSTFDKNKKFIIDLFFDYYIKQIKELEIEKKVKMTKQAYISRSESSFEIEKTIKAINSIIQKIKQDENVCIKILDRKKDERITINKNLENIALSQLSLGEINLFNMFVNILRHADMSTKILDYTKTEGIVVIDEIEAHLHTKFQTKILPDLIELFPKIQFIITTHSPMFILGMKEKFGEDGFDIFEMPTGKKIPAEEFKEFSDTYDIFTTTQKFKHLINLKKPIVMVEGITDVEYIKTAFEIFEQQKILENFELVAGDGAQKLLQFLNGTHDEFLEKINRKILIIFDCDISDNEIEKAEKIKELNNEKRKINIEKIINLTKYYRLNLHNNPIKNGIENLFSKNLIEELISNDKTRKCIKEHKNNSYKIIREGGQKNDNLYKYNKKTIQEEICKNYATKENFVNFEEIVKKIEEFLNKDNINAN